MLSILTAIIGALLSLSWTVLIALLFLLAVAVRLLWRWGLRAGDRLWDGLAARERRAEFIEPPAPREPRRFKPRPAPPYRPFRH